MRGISGGGSRRRRRRIHESHVGVFDEGFDLEGRC